MIRFFIVVAWLLIVIPVEAAKPFFPADKPLPHELRVRIAELDVVSDVEIEVLCEDQVDVVSSIIDSTIYREEKERFARDRDTTISVLAIVEMDGSLVCSMFEGSGSLELGFAAMSVVNQWKFTPASKDGRNVRCSLRVELRVDVRRQLIRGKSRSIAAITWERKKTKSRTRRYRQPRWRRDFAERFSFAIVTGSVSELHRWARHETNLALR